MPANTMLVAIGPWRPSPFEPDFEPLRRALLARLGPPQESGIRMWRREGLLLVAHLALEDVLVVIDTACRGRSWTCAVCLRPPAQPDLPARRALAISRRSPWGVAVRRDHADTRVPAVGAVLALHVSILRDRRPAAWQAIDAKRVGRTAVAASAALGVSPQAVTKQLRRSHDRATAATAIALAALLDEPAGGDTMR